MGLGDPARNANEGLQRQERRQLKLDTFEDWRRCKRT